jgi:transposase
MDKAIEGVDVAVGAVVSEGERRSSTLSPARDDEAVAALAPGQRWSLSRKRDVVLRLLQGEAVEGLSRRLAVPVWKLEEWRQRGLAGIDAGLRERDDDPKERELAEAHRRIGELSMANELLRARLEKPGPLARRRSR